MRFLSPREYRTLQVAKRKWLVPGLLPEAVWVLLVGAPKSGKSFFALQMALALAAGRPFIGYKPSRPLTTVYVDIDSPIAETQERLERVADRGNELAEADRVRLVHPEDIKRPVDITTPPGLAWLRQVREATPDLVVLDVLREYHTLDEDESHEMKRVTDAIATALPPPVTLLILHHTKKIPDDLPRIDPVKYARGSGGIAGRVDAVWLLHQEQLHMVPRYEKASKIRLAQDDDGFWTAPDAVKHEQETTAALAFCADNPTVSHNKLKGMAMAAIGMSESTFMRRIRGQVCAHRET